jgi:hypothetical protein
VRTFHFRKKDFLSDKWSSPYNPKTTQHTPTVIQGLRWPLIGAGILIISMGVALAPPIKPQQEAEWLSQLAPSGDAGAQLQLGLAYREGRYGLAPDPHTGLYWLERSAESGNIYAADLVGTAYAEGQGTEVDKKRARHWWQVAARGGNVDAKKRLGKLLSGDEPGQGLVGLHNLSAVADQLLVGKAIRNQSATALQQRAQAGDPVAQYELAMRYRDGSWGVPRNPALAQKWLERAAAAGNPLAHQTLKSNQKHQ